MAATDIDTMQTADGTHVLGQQMREFFKQTRPAALINLVVGSGIAFVLWGRVETIYLAPWLAAIVTVAIARLLIYRRFDPSLPDNRLGSLWSNRFVLISAVTGALWGALPVLFLNIENTFTLGIILVTIAGMTGGGLGALSAHFRSFAAFACTAMLPLAGTLLALADVDMAVIAAIVIVMLLALLRFAGTWETAILDQIRFRFAVDGLIARVAKERRTIETVSQNLQAEQQRLRAAEQENITKTRFLEAILESMEQGILVNDKDQRITLFNRQASDLAGVPAEFLASQPTSRQLLERQLSRGSAPESDETLQRLLEGWEVWAADESATEAYQYERQRPDGRWLLVYGRKLPDGGAVRTLTDITERKRAEQAQRELLDSIPVPIVLSPIDGHDLLYTNEAGRTLYGLREDGPERHRLTGVYRDLDRRRELLDRLHKEGGVDEFEIELHGLNDDSIWVLAHGRQIEYQGRPCALIASYPITERKRLEHELEQRNRSLEAARDAAEATEARMRAIVRALPVGVLVYEADQRLEFWNETYSRLTGLSDEVLSNHQTLDAISLYIWENFPAYQAIPFDDFLARRKQDLAANKTVAKEMAYTRPRYDVQDIIAPLPNGAAVNVIVDITAQKQAAREALQAKEAAEEATRAKSAFLAAVSHEIRTPMNGVIGLVEVLERGKLDEDQRSLSRTINESANQLLHIIDGILDFSKIEADRMELETVPVQIRQISESVFDTLAPSAKRKHLDLALTITPSVPPVFLGDAVRLRQILMNLLSNAVKFTQAGSVELAITATLDQADPSFSWIDFRVTDTGIGIPYDRHKTLFEPFQQAESSTTRRFGGTGLGLSICARLVELMGGKIGVNSTEAVGSTFWFRIPAEPAAVRATSAADAVDLDGLTALLIEESQPVARMVRSLLEPKGMSVTVVFDVENGLSALDESGDRDLLLLGRSAGGNGSLAALIDRFRTPDGPATLRAIRLHAHPTDTPDREAERSVSISVPDPIRRDTLLSMIGVVLGRGSPTPETETADTDLLVAGSADAPSVDDARAAGRLILVAEDNETNQIVVQRQLAILGYAAEVAADGIEALKKWRAGDYGLLLTDCHMPNMDGYALAEAVRREEAERATRGSSNRMPIIALTANVMAGEAERCLEVGMDDYLAKPAPLSAMAKALAHWLGQPETAETHGQAVETDNAPTGSSTEPIDRAALTAILGTDEDKVIGFMLRTFRESYAKQTDRIATGVADNDMALVREAAHTAAGAAGNAGATTLSTALRALEAAAKNGDEAGAHDSWQTVQTEHMAVLRHIDALLAKI